MGRIASRCRSEWAGVADEDGVRLGLHELRDLRPGLPDREAVAEGRRRGVPEPVLEAADPACASLAPSGGPGTPEPDRDRDSGDAHGAWPALQSEPEAGQEELSLALPASGRASGAAEEGDRLPPAPSVLRRLRGEAAAVGGPGESILSQGGEGTRRPKRGVGEVWQRDDGGERKNLKGVEDG